MPQTKIKEISRGRLFARVCAVKMHMEMSQEPVFIREFAGKRSRPETGKTVFASLHSRNAHGHVRILCENSQVNCRRPRSRMAHVADFVRACTVEMHTRARKRLAQIPLDMQTVRRATLCENFQVKCRRPISSKPRGADFARACAVEMHMDIAQEPVYARIYRKEAGSQMEHPDQAPVFTPTVTTPQCGHNVWGTYCITYKTKTRQQKTKCHPNRSSACCRNCLGKLFVFFTTIVLDSASLNILWNFMLLLIPGSCVELSWTCFDLSLKLFGFC